MAEYLAKTRQEYESQRLHRALKGPLPNVNIGLGDEPRVVRFKQSGHIHGELQRLLFSDDGEAFLLAQPYTITDATGADVSASLPRPTIERSSFRIATFLISTNASGEATTIQLITTYATQGFITITLTDVERMDSYQHAIVVALLKSVVELMRTSTCRDRHVMISIDIYYNRSLDAGGAWHQDVNYGTPTLDPTVVALEYFCDQRMLGPEIMLLPGTGHERPPLPLSEQTEAHADVFFRKSCRVIVEDGSVLIFNNTSTIHATPWISRPNDAAEVAALHINQRTMAADEGRAENIANGFNPLVANTRSQRRSFARSHLRVLTPAEFQVISTNITSGATRSVNVMLFLAGGYERPIFDCMPISFDEMQPPPRPPFGPLKPQPPDSPFFGGTIPPLRNFFIQNKRLYINEYVPLTPINEKDLKKIQQEEEIFIANFNTMSNQLDGGKKKYRSHRNKLQKRKKSRKRNKN